MKVTVQEVEQPKPPRKVVIELDWEEARNLAHVIHVYLINEFDIPAFLPYKDFSKELKRLIESAMVQK